MFEPSESITEACVREAYEELNITIAKQDLQFINVSHLKLESNEDYFAFSFFVTKWNGEPINKETEKHDEGSWFSLDKLPKDIVPHGLTVINAYKDKIYYCETGW